MPETFQGRVLKSGYARTVYVDAAGRVVKRFHHPNPLQALRDRRRAVGERRALAALFAADLPVPRPLGVRRARGGRGAPLGAWEVVMERIDGAVELAAVVAGQAAAPLAPAELARRVGAILAAGQRAGLDHPDLHPGNWLVDAAGRVWLVDFHKARVRPRPGGRPRELALRDLLTLVAYLRETLAPDARRALIEAWAEEREAGERRSDERRGAGATERAALVRAIEAAARPHRRAWVAHARGRWTRESSRCVVHAGAGPRGAPAFLRRGAPDAAELLAAVTAAADATPGAEVRALGGGRYLLAVARDAAEHVALWANAARLVEHRLPALAPAAACGRAAALALPRDAAPAAELGAGEAGAALGALHDRGLDVPALAGLAWASAEGVHLAPPARLAHVDPGAGRMEVARRFAACAQHAGDAAFRAAYVGAMRGSAEERSALAEELVGG